MEEDRLQEEQACVWLTKTSLALPVTAAVTCAGFFFCLALLLLLAPLPLPLFPSPPSESPKSQRVLDELLALAEICRLRRRAATRCCRWCCVACRGCGLSLAAAAAVRAQLKAITWVPGAQHTWRCSLAYLLGLALYACHLGSMLPELNAHASTCAVTGAQQRATSNMVKAPSLRLRKAVTQLATPFPSTAASTS